MWRGYQSCGEVIQPSERRLPNLWRDYLWRGYLVARLQSGYRWQSNISLESATFQLHFGRALSSKILWPTKINLLRQKQKYFSKCGAAIEWCWASFKSGTGYSLHQAPETPDNMIHWPNADVMLGHCLQRLVNIIPIKTLYGLITIFNHEHIFYLNTS